MPERRWTRLEFKLCTPARGSRVFWALSARAEGVRRADLSPSSSQEPNVNTAKRSFINHLKIVHPIRATLGAADGWNFKRWPLKLCILIGHIWIFLDSTFDQT